MVDAKPLDKNSRIGFLILNLVCLLLLLLSVYVEDFYTVRKVISVQAYFTDFCMENGRYPKKEEFKKRFPMRAEEPVWFYRPAEDLKSSTFNT